MKTRIHAIETRCRLTVFVNSALRQSINCVINMSSSSTYKSTFWMILHANFFLFLFTIFCVTHCNFSSFSLQKWLADYRNSCVCIALVLGKCVHSSACNIRLLRREKKTRNSISILPDGQYTVYIYCSDDCLLRRPKHVA